MSQSPTDQITPESTVLYRQGWKALNRLLHEDRSFSGNERNCAFLNCGGQFFTDISSISGFDFPDDARAVVSCDWDFDGDLDLWTTARTAPRLRLLQNRSPSKGSWISLLLTGNGRNTNINAVGARLELHLAGHDVPLLKTVHAGDAFLSQSSLWQHFPLPSGAEIERLVIKWPGGNEQIIAPSSIPTGFRYTISQDQNPLAWQPPAQRMTFEKYEPETRKASESARIILSGRMPIPPVYVSNGSADSAVELDPESLKGPLLLNIWATWCAPCLEELKEWSDLEPRFNELGLRVIAMNSEPALHETAEKILKNFNFPFQSFDADEKTIRNLDVFQQSILDRWTPMPVPTSFLIDHHGMVAAIYKGKVHVEQLAEDLKLLKSSPEQVRQASVPFAGRWAGSPQSFNPLLVNAQFVAYNQINEGVKYLSRFTEMAARSNSVSPSMLANISYVIGVIQNDSGDLQGAISSFRKALEFSSDDFRSLRELGEALLKTGDHSSALDLLQKALNINSQNIEARRLMSRALLVHAEILSQKGDYPVAVANLKSALSYDASQLDAAYLLASILLNPNSGQSYSPQESLALAQKLCQITRNSNPDYLLIAAKAFLTNNNPDSAHRSAELALNIFASSGQTQKAQAAAQLIQEIKNQ